ncbi:copper homeostasis protein cutC homolog isoform X1 [Parus major]|uniref:copper homeostasis protein cutC homolog isoform X1 n=1 Tax=Pseudopodoces humilis TaxID=181119 RepID=UPI0006B8553B|nr:PREDICTED: copper homeostasis protein cutC homolog isoform X1 [Pseudopodoces humilis]XP_015488184.1 copper homeostasis protein cutC homolog isoform X1 [Parus major]XP_058696920.1 copper homeostasis protein cutC homolog isoform X1 [Poecile atricapillus]
MTIARRVTGSAEQRPPRAASTGMDDGFLMEVCVDSVESAVNAERGGAGRIELCAGLVEGGTTPSMGLLQVVKQCVRVPVFVMIRPRGGDFLYSDREVEVMKADIRLAKLHGADGLVFGALTEDGRIDTELCTALLAVCRPLPVTFHRAFDMVHDPLVALETLISLGFERVLTSGCDSSALEGLSLIKRLAEQAKGRIVVVPGGGITERNLQRILEGSTASEFHCSARSARDSGMKFRNPNVAMGASFSAPEYSIKVADVAKVRTLNAIAKNIL